MPLRTHELHPTLIHGPLALLSAAAIEPIQRPLGEAERAQGPEPRA